MIFWGIAVLGGLWLSVGWGAGAPPQALQAPGYEVRMALSNWLWSGRYLLAVIVAIVLHPQVISRPFALARSAYLPGRRGSQATRLAFLYYVALVGTGSLLFMWIRSSLIWPSLNVHPTLTSLSGGVLARPWAVLIGFLFVSAVNARFCWQSGHFLQRRDLETWVAFGALAALQMALLAWLDVAWQISWPRLPVLWPWELRLRDWLGALQWPTLDLPAFPDISWRLQLALPAWLNAIWRASLALLFVGLPTTSFALAWVSPGTMTPKWLATVAAFLVSLIVSVLMLSPYMAPRLHWIAIGATMVLVVFTLLMGAASSHRRGFLTHLYQRYRLRWQRLESRELLKVTDSDAPLIRELRPLLRPGIRVAVLVANVLLQVIGSVSNVALFAILWLIELSVRVPEMIGASIVRLGRAAIFYVQYLVIPLLMFSSVGIAIGNFVTTLSNYQATPTIGSGISMILSVAVAILGINAGLASLFELPLSRVIALYMKWGQDETGKTPIDYLVYLLLSMWLLHSLGLLFGRLAWMELYLALRPGMFYILESLLVLGGLTVLLAQLTRRKR